MKEKLKTFVKGGWKHMARVAMQGLFWLAPVVAIVAVLFWLYGKIDYLTGLLFELFGFDPQRFVFLWSLFGLAILFAMAYFVGRLVETRLGTWTDILLKKIPGFSTIKDLVNIFNSSKKGEKQVLVVLVRGFANQGYNVGLMYSQKESVLENHYTVTLSQTPIPNGGYMFEVHRDHIWVIKEASFDNNLQYLLSMGVKSLAEIVGVDARPIEALDTLTVFLQHQSQQENNENQ